MKEERRKNERDELKVGRLRPVASVVHLLERVGRLGKHAECELVDASVPLGDELNLDVAAREMKV
jgi:hypothetical protein